MLSYILDIAFCNFLKVGYFYPTHSMQQSTLIHHIRIIILIFDQNHNIQLECCHSNDNKKYSKQNLILTHKVTYEMVFFVIFQIKMKKCCKSAIIDSGRFQSAMGGDIFLVYPKGIRNICAKFQLSTNFFQVTVQIYCTINY